MAAIGIADTTFSRVNMGRIAEDTIRESGEQHRLVRYTVPGVKDLPVAAKRLFAEHGCDIVVACGMVGHEAVDKACGHEASTAIQQVQLMVDRHVLEVFVHMDEAEDDADLLLLATNRTRKHALNALALLKGPTSLTPLAGTGRRQGRNDVGGIPDK
ncbi:TPA: riboflavin synthase [Candidatus Woesearchaeota archaeon]|nr:riboflavin synthase [Candidatus Woesearchaeota archaeon]HII69443.1 riboflavin synthase [Candidatus Woesearchaeota archaeon]